MGKGKYILSPGATGDVHTAPLLKKSGVKKTCFALGTAESLDQEDLEHLFENGLTALVIKVEIADDNKTPKPLKSDKK